MDRTTTLGAGLLAVAAVGVAALFLRDHGAADRPSAADLAVLERVEAFEARLAAIERRLGLPGPRSEDADDTAARLLALELAMLELREERPRGAAVASPGDGARAGATPAPGAAAGGGEAALALGGGGSGDAVKDEVLAAVEDRIDAAVAKKAEEIEAKRNKRPSLDTFAELLELDAHQREMIDREVREGQWRIRDIMQTPTADGGNLLDELIDVMASGQAGRPETGALWAKWWGRVMNEKIPGTDETYAARIDAVKGTVRDGFRRELTEAQYAEFEAWQLDPTEIQGVTDGAWSDFEQLTAERAEQLRGQ